MLKPGTLMAAVAWTSLKTALSSQAQVGRFTLVVAAGARVTLVSGSVMCWYARAARISGLIASSYWGGGGSPLSTQKGMSLQEPRLSGSGSLGFSTPAQNIPLPSLSTL